MYEAADAHNTSRRAGAVWETSVVPIARCGPPRAGKHSGLPVRASLQQASVQSEFRQTPRPGWESHKVAGFNILRLFTTRL